MSVIYINNGVMKMFERFAGYPVATPGNCVVTVAV
ncbi:hypothetical protein BN8_01627 [Fibrisoma limi BUZ 3]|uniref:Uncharacterized protein n=1 Tax=Fibrisoma limi BUZ 3 TaxID=1185876 RepID=I2GFD9_9BACT|nr:hypothetical protein BN8_01627 [Fibrisoma limi BUZ 3]